uniref:Uncharacterized protein n=1 Tax=Arundo donax TaxID=35708 RepID=A0A0A9A4T6_ARUDO
MYAWAISSWYISPIKSQFQENFQLITVISLHI